MASGQCIVEIPTNSEESQSIRSYRDSVAWQKAMELVGLVYRLAATFPAFEQYGLRSQLTRAAVSVPANIAEVQALATSRDFANFLNIARSSLVETDTLLEVAIRQGYVTEGQASAALSLIGEIGKMLTRLRGRILDKGRGA